MIRALLMLALSACGSAPTVGPKLLTPDDDTHNVTATAVDWINFQAGAELVRVAPGGLPVERCAVPGSCGYHTGKRICIERCSDVTDLSAVVAIHEIGHAFGLRHSRWRGAVMAPQLQQLDYEEAARSLVSALPGGL